MDTEELFAEPTQRHEQKRRRCLRCQGEFDSEWAGDRICHRCKHSSAWRAGQPPSAPASNKGRAPSGRPSGQ